MIQDLKKMKSLKEVQYILSAAKLKMVYGWGQNVPHRNNWFRTYASLYEIRLRTFKDNLAKSVCQLRLANFKKERYVIRSKLPHRNIFPTILFNDRWKRRPISFESPPTSEKGCFKNRSSPPTGNSQKKGLHC